MLSALCLRCGLCCDGTLFRHVEIQSTERERLEALGLPCGENRKREVMLLPCGKLEGKCCSIYEQRPQGCRAFVCALGRRLVAKELGVAEAEATVDDMLARLEALRAVFPDSGNEPILRFARARISDPMSRVTDDQLAAFKRVEELRYAAFVPPTV